MRSLNIAMLAAIVLIASLTASGAWAQAFTFGSSVSEDDVRARADRGARKAKGQQARRCRAERHQVYDAQGQLIWRTIQICG
jgi:hypothetical protein